MVNDVKRLVNLLRSAVTRRILAFLFLISLALLELSCQRIADSKWSDLKYKYAQDEKDSLKLKAVKFLEQSLATGYIEQLDFRDIASGKSVCLRLDTASSEKSLQNMLAKKKLYYTYIRVFDKDIVNLSAIDRDIAEAFETRNRYSWSRNVADSLFLHYVLPYKVAAEYPREWRLFFKDKYAKKLDSLDKLRVSDVEDVTRFLVKDVESWYSYSSENFLTSPFPDLYELLYSAQGECYRISYLCTYVLRAAGIPCVVDVAPLWGSKNAGHAEYTSLNKDGELRSNVATTHKNGLARAAKVFRLTFENYGSFSQEINPVIGEEPFLIPFLKHDHVIDVTDQHANTYDVSYSLPEQYADLPFAYICALNYGRWRPVFWGTVNNGSAVVKKMNTNILYRIGLPDGSGLQLLDEIFFIDTLGRRQRVGQGVGEIARMMLTKTNSGEDALLEQGERYMLQKLKADGAWQNVKSLLADKDRCIKVDKMDVSCFYRLLKKDSDETLERPFRWWNNEQEWW